MKVALILTGYMRNWEEHYPNIKKNIIDKYKPNIFICSYDHSQHSIGKEIVPIDTQKVIDTYKPKKYIFRSQEDTKYFDLIDGKNEKIGREWSERTIRSWYNIYRSLKLFRPSAYDVILRIRCDLSVENFEIDSSKNLVIPAHKVHPGPCEPEDSFIEHFAYGKPEYMKKYLSMYEKLESLHHENCDISVGEVILKDYIEKYIGLENVSLDYNVDWKTRDELWASEVQKICLDNVPEFAIQAPSTEKDECNPDDSQDDPQLK